MSPQTSPERRERWPGMDSQAIKFLEGLGYKQTRQWTWLPPNRPEGPTDKELDAITYLVEEFDWGGLEEPPRTRTCTDTRTEVPLTTLTALLEGANIEVPDQARFWVDRRREVLVIRHMECS